MPRQPKTSNAVPKKVRNTDPAPPTRPAIELRGARQHNLQGIDLHIPSHQLTVLCGVSGSGKTSLALDTLYAEGQRRYIESFSAYTRQFLERIDRPKFDSLVHLPPAIAMTRDQRGRNQRSTVGTASEILEYLRVVFANRARLHCYQCQRSILSHSPKTIAEWMQAAPAARAMIGFEIRWRDRKELALQLFDLQTSGLVRLVVAEKTVHLADSSREDLAQDFSAKGSAIVIVDRLQTGSGMAMDRALQSVATALEHVDLFGNHSCVVLTQQADSPSTSAETSISNSQQVDSQTYEVFRFSSQLRCEHCDIDYPESEPRLFHFNSPIGACPECEGFGEVVSIDRHKVIPDPSLSLAKGAIAPWRTPAYAHELEELLALADDYQIPVDVPVSKLKASHWKWIEKGVPERQFGGLDGFFAWLERKKYKMHVRAFLARWRTYATCPTCQGRRLNRKSLAYTIEQKSFADLCDLSVDELLPIINDLNLRKDRVTSSDVPLAKSLGISESHAQYSSSEPTRQTIHRLGYLQQVGLGYLALSRPLHTLSTGESQRVQMTALLGSSLVDMLYVLDEPTVGLHPQDTERLATAILGLRDRGNTVVLVEHEPYLMRVADRIVEIGPKAGEQGGRVVFEGSPQEMLTSSSVTASYLNRKKATPRNRQLSSKHWLHLKGASGRNLQIDQLSIPLGTLTVMIGPSGAGKSTLVLDTLCPAVSKHLQDEEAPEPLPYRAIEGVELLRGCIAIDQSPIQRSNRSCPATYSKALDEIRQVFAGTADAKARGMTTSHFSFNSESGRCPTCEGLGYTMVDMQFMADIELVCQDCDGKRYKPEVLEVRYRDLSIDEVLQMSVERAGSFFREFPKVRERLQPLTEIGLGYLPLGQSLRSISAGESMRLKLATHLEQGQRQQTKDGSNGLLIVMDEPTTGLHFSDIERLIHCLNVMVEHGHTVLVIEHNQQMMEAADHLIELGPGAGIAGGRIVAQGSMAEVLSNPQSVTAKYLH